MALLTSSAYASRDVRRLFETMKCENVKGACFICLLEIINTEEDEDYRDMC